MEPIFRSPSELKNFSLPELIEEAQNSHGNIRNCLAIASLDVDLHGLFGEMPDWAMQHLTIQHHLKNKVKELEGTEELEKISQFVFEALDINKEIKAQIKNIVSPQTYANAKYELKRPTLDLSGCTEIKDLSFLKNCPNLQSLDLRGCTEIMDFSFLLHLDLQPPAPGASGD